MARTRAHIAISHIQKNFKIQHSVLGTSPVELWTVQKNIIKQMEKSRYLIYNKYRLTGFSTLVALYSTWLLQHDKKSNILILCESEQCSARMMNKIRVNVIDGSCRLSKNRVICKKNGNSLLVTHKISPGETFQNIFIDEAFYIKHDIKVVEEYITADSVKKCVVYSEYEFPENDTSWFGAQLKKTLKREGLFQLGSLLD